MPEQPSAHACSGSGPNATGSDYERTLRELAADVENLIARTRTQLDVALPSYRAVPDEAVRASVALNLRAACDALASHRGVPSHRDLIAIEQRISSRVEQGLRIETVIQGYRTSISVIHERFLQIALSNEVAPNLILAAARELWTLGDAITAHAAAAYQRLGLDDAIRESHLRTEFLRELLTGGLSKEQMESHLNAFGLDPHGQYAALKGRSSDDQTGGSLRRDLERAGSAGWSPAVVGVSGPDCVGVVPQTPRVGNTGTVAVGPTVPIQELPESFDLAVRTFEWMIQNHRVGVVDYSEASWRLMVPKESHLIAWLKDRYLGPLRSYGEFGDLLLESLASYLRHDRNVRRAAEALVVHPNTLRYRLQKYAEITGVKVESTECIIEVSLALEGNEA